MSNVPPWNGKGADQPRGVTAQGAEEKKAEVNLIELFY